MLDQLVLCVVSALVFATIRWFMVGKANGFVIDLVSLFFALLVFVSQSILGWKL